MQKQSPREKRASQQTGSKQVVIELGSKALKDTRKSTLQRCLNMVDLSDWQLNEENRNCDTSLCHLGCIVIQRSDYCVDFRLSVVIM